jgi:capsular polysaccharide biosynthesis protein
MNEREDEIDLLELVRALWHRAWVLVLAMIICGAAAFSCAEFLVTPLYEASAMLYINNSAISVGSTKVSISSGDLSASQSLISTYSVILKSRSTLEDVIDATGVPYTYEELKLMVSASAVDSTEVMEITTTDADPEEASKITNAIVSILSDRIVAIVEGSSVQVVDKSVVPTEPVSPDVLRYTLIGVLLGLVLSAGVIVVITLVDTTVRTEDDLLQNFTDIPLLASIPNLNNHKHGYGYGYGYGYGETGTKKDVKRSAV